MPPGHYSPSAFRRSDSLESGHILLPMQPPDHEHAAYDWFADMLSCKFFTPCQRHVDVRRNEVGIGVPEAATPKFAVRVVIPGCTACFQPRVYPPCLTLNVDPLRP